jgi:tetratricopeptide (TPR) repeat protein
VDHEQVSAANSLIKLIASNPLDVPVYLRLAGVYQSAGEFRKAELTLRRAIEIDALRPEAWTQLGSLYSTLGDWRAAADSFAQAVTLDAVDAATLANYGMALIGAQDARTADTVCRTLLDKFPGRSEGHLLAGHLSKIRGKVEQATESYGRALQHDPRQTDAMFNLVELSPPELTDPLTERLETLRRDPSLSVGQLANVQFALARIYEHAGQLDRCFALLQEANATTEALMRRSGHGYDPKRQEEDAGRLIAMFDSAALATQLTPLEIELKMIFIVGLPRSGTTLVDRILSSHSRVTSGGELPFMQDCLVQLRGGGIDVRVPAQRQLLEQLREQYVDAIFERELDAEYVIDKLPANFSAVGLIRMLFPDAVIVHCTRDPIATCWSLYSANFGTHLSYYTSFEHLVHYYKVYSRLMAHWNRVFGSTIVTVEYEKLVADPERRIRELLAACGLVWEDACLNSCSNDQPIYTASMQQARRPIYTESIDRWRKFEKHLAPLINGLRTG